MLLHYRNCVYAEGYIPDEGGVGGYGWRRGEWEAAVGHSEKAEELWEECYKKLSLYTPHSKLDSISQNLATLRSLASCHVKEQLYTEAARCKSQIIGLEKTEYPTVDNIL